MGYTLLTLSKSRCVTTLIFYYGLSRIPFLYILPVLCFIFMYHMVAFVGLLSGQDDRLKSDHTGS